MDPGMGRHRETQSTLLDDILRDLEPVLNEINAMPLPEDEKKRLTRRWLETRIGQHARAQRNSDATKPET
jgi:hypothetical protein